MFSSAGTRISKLSISGCCNGKQRCHMSLLDTMIGEFESSGAPVRCLGRLQNLRMEASRASSHWFDVPHNFQLATQRALDAQEETFKALQGALAWAAESSASSVASRMRACAELCARAEQHDGAAALLHLAILRDPVEDSSRSPISKLTVRIDAAQAWRLEVASPLLSAGAVQPWPPVLAVLARDGGADVARAMALLAAPFMRAADAMDNGALYESRPGGIDALLREASAHGCEALVEQLLELECSALEVDENGSTPLHMAAAAGHIGTCKLLMSADANPLVVNSLGLSALELAINGGHSALQRVLSPTVADFEMNGQLATTLPAFQPDANGRTTGITTLMLFVHANDMRATSLLDMGDPADFLPSSAAPALFGWMQTGLKAIGSGLKEIGSGQEQNTNDDSQQLVNVLSPRGCTALTIAAEAGALSMVAALLTARADPNLGRPPPLSCACLFNHVEVATRLLAAKASPDAHFPNLPGWPANVEDRSPEQGKASSCEESLLAFMPCSALGIAASIGSATIAEVLLSAGATADLRMLSERPQRSESTKHHVQPVSIPGPTALSIAAAHGHAMVAKVLLKHGADANFASRPTLQAGTDTLQFEPPLITAAQLGHEGVCRVLLQHGARIDIATDDQKTALHVASAEGHVCVVRTCLEFGAALDLILPQPSASTILSPLQAAAAFGHADVCTALVHARAFVDFHQGSTYTPLRLACRNDHEEVARVLIQMRADLEATSSGGTARRAAPRPTALGEAVKMCHTNLVRLLLDAGADPRGGSGNYGAGGSANYGSALICCMRESLTRLRSDAAQGGDASVRHLETVKLLLRHRASLDDVDERGLTALHHACKNGLDDCVDLLITARAGLDVVNCDGNTALMYATAYQGSMYSAEAHHIAQKLTSAHADINVVNQKGQTAIVLAASGKRPRHRMVELLKGCGAQHDSVELERLTGRLGGVPEGEEGIESEEEGSGGKDEGFTTFESFESCEAVGLVWQPIDAKPIDGHELALPVLREALASGQTTFTKAEMDSFSVSGLQTAVYIKASDGQWFAPADSPLDGLLPSASTESKAKSIRAKVMEPQYAMLHRVEAEEDKRLQTTEGPRAEVMDPQYAMLMKVEAEEDQRLRGADGHGPSPATRSNKKFQLPKIRKTQGH